MRFAVAATVLMLLPLVHAEPTGPHIAEILPDPGEDREFIELASPEAVDLTGWAIEDAAGNRFDLSGQSIAAGGRLVVWGGGEATPDGPAWSKSTVWNNGGDTALLLHGTTVVDSFSYGSAGGPPAPATGQSLALLDGAWAAGDPTPGRAPGTHGGTASMTVQDVAPGAAFDALPAHVAPGEAVDVTWTVWDDNGDDVTWNLTSAGAVVAQGGAGEHAATLTAPITGPWQLVLHAVAGDQATTATATIGILQDGLRVVLPSEGIRFPDIAPGARNVTATAPFAIHNDGDAPVVPRIDVADFSGPASFPAAGRLSVVIAGQVVPYDSPLAALPELAPGASMDVLLRLDEVPVPLSAGVYGTSFTVVA